MPAVHSYHLSDANGRIGGDHLDTMVEPLRLRAGARAGVDRIGVAALAGPQMRVEIQVAAIVEDEIERLGRLGC
ncbi:hypothetical protein [Mycobacterium sp. E1747]|uniref:hypothetical protein n=1 Tax=Mycobacterium sp. E1747 TaxID=1834128 RepID=UPI0007FC6619|nr:hypothetical protein [Mycobacterium sp. E1747]OBH07373.1 hypothetical protein A5695_02945 [Mycobacterium sp. E1747]